MDTQEILKTTSTIIELIKELKEARELDCYDCNLLAQLQRVMQTFQASYIMRLEQQQHETFTAQK